MVMLGPPNQGAAIARRLAPTGLFGFVTGKGGDGARSGMGGAQKGWRSHTSRLSVVAGDLSHNPVQNPLVDGSSDLIVSVDEAKLDGAERMETVPVLHSFLMNDEKVQGIDAGIHQGSLRRVGGDATA